MNARQHSEYMAAQSARNIRTKDATGYNVGEGVWYGADTDGTIKLFIGNANGHKILFDAGTGLLTVVGDITVQDGSITAPKLDVDELSAISADLGAITAGDLTLNTAGSFIKLGTAGFESGVGFHVEYNSGTPRLFLGDAAGNNVSWNGSLLRVRGQIELGNVQTFTPTWTGFSSAPSGDLSYVDLGNLAIIFSTASRTGTSNATTMSITNVPAAIQPPSTAKSVCAITADEGSGAVQRIGVWGMSGATLGFGMLRVLAAPGSVIDDFASFNTGGTKGVPSGWFVMYPK